MGHKAKILFFYNEEYVDNVIIFAIQFMAFYEYEGELQEPFISSMPR